MAKQIHFAVDIDQTICGSNAFEVYAKFHNEDLKLEITAESIKLTFKLR
jgi:hypothetical protein